MNILAPLVQIESIDRDELNRLLVLWGHRIALVEILTFEPGRAALSKAEAAK